MLRQNIVYKDTPEDEKNQNLDLYLPQSTSALPPLLIYIHGGLWLGRDKQDFNNVGHFLAAKGLAVALINYRRSAKDNQVVHSMHTQDSADAVEYLFKKASEYKYDANNIFLCGHSCGGHMMGLMLLNRNKYLKNCELQVRGCICVEGLFDQELFLKDFPDYTNDIEMAFTKNKSNWESPQHTPLNPPAMSTQTPWLLIHSTEDTWLYSNQSIKFAHHLKELKFQEVQVVTENIKGGHMEIIFWIGTNRDQLSNLFINFIQQHIKATQ